MLKGGIAVILRLPHATNRPSAYSSPHPRSWVTVILMLPTRLELKQFQIEVSVRLTSVLSVIAGFGK